MAIGRSLMSVTGKVAMTEPMIKTYWKGMTVVRCLAHKIDQVPSEVKKEINIKLSECAAKWKELTKYERDGWEEYASLIKSAMNRASEDVATGSKNIIRHRSKLESGFNAYVEGNLLSHTTGVMEKNPEGQNVLRKVAPIGIGFPPAPLDVKLVYDPLTHKAKVTWTDPLTQEPAPAERHIRIWARMDVTPKGIVHPQIVGVVPFGTKELEFDQLDTTGSNGGTRKLTDFHRFILQVQLETVVALTALQGSVVGSPSAIAEVKEGAGPD